MASELRRIKTTNVSLHYQAQLYLRELITAGAYQPGQRLPPEGVFAEQLGISRPTLREALHNLEVEGMIVRKHGVGTFVSSSHASRMESGLEVLESLERIASRMGLMTRMGDLHIEERLPRPDELAALECRADEKVLSVERIILVGSKPVAYLWDVVRARYLRAADLDDKFQGSVLDIFIKRGHPKLAYSFTRLASVGADARLARQLDMPRRTPLLKLEARLYTEDNQIVDYSISNFVPDYFDFHIIRRIGNYTENKL
jgi:GntR family transcriptional regulator